jgi:hypothetical protein
MKRIPTLWRNEETTSYAKFQQFRGNNSRELKRNFSVGILSSFGEEETILNICCRTQELLLHFIKFITTAKVQLLLLTTFSPRQHLDTGFSDFPLSSG